MPIQREHVQLAALFLCVPAQLLISQYMGSTESNRTYAISQLVGQWTHIQENWLRVESWKSWCKRLLNLKMRDIMLDPLGLMDPLGECPAVEVFKFRDKDGYFGQSPEPRDARPPHVQFRVGQVVKHKRWGYRGVIIGWDETAVGEALSLWINLVAICSGSCLLVGRDAQRKPNLARPTKLCSVGGHTRPASPTDHLCASRKPGSGEAHSNSSPLD